MRYTEGYTAVRIDVKHIQKRGKAGWRYRRKVPAPLRQILGKTEIVIPLGKTEQEALRRYDRVQSGVEKLLADATRKMRSPVLSQPQDHMGPLEQYQWAEREIRALQLDTAWSGVESEFDAEGIARDVIADGIVKKYPLDDEGYPIGVDAKDAALLRSLAYGARQVRPEPTLEDARKLYLKEKVGDDDKKQMELERIFKLVKEALGRDRTLRSLRREDAKEVRDHMLDGRKASSVDRYLNVVRAVINHATREYDLAGLMNPFMNLEAAPKDKAEPDRDKKRPFTAKELTATRARILRMARADIQHIWRILENTGCRLAEVAGLRVEDVRLDHVIPHIVVEWHDDRRIKNSVSRRKVPLIGDALEAAQEALKVTKGPMLFPAYGRKGGPSSASAALSNHVRACVPDPKVTTHSLRHLMKDRLRLAGVSKADQDIVLGHSSGSVGEDYGGDEARLEVASKALLKVFPEVG